MTNLRIWESICLNVACWWYHCLVSNTYIENEQSHVTLSIACVVVLTSSVQTWCYSCASDPTVQWLHVQPTPVTWPHSVCPQWWERQRERDGHDVKAQQKKTSKGKLCFCCWIFFFKCSIQVVKFKLKNVLVKKCLYYFSVLNARFYALIYKHCYTQVTVIFAGCFYIA